MSLVACGKCRRWSIAEIPIPFTDRTACDCGIIIKTYSSVDATGSRRYKCRNGTIRQGNRMQSCISLACYISNDRILYIIRTRSGIGMRRSGHIVGYSVITEVPIPMYDRSAVGIRRIVGKDYRICYTSICGEIEICNRRIEHLEVIIYFLDTATSI